MVFPFDDIALFAQSAYSAYSALQTMLFDVAIHSDSQYYVKLFIVQDTFPLIRYVEKRSARSGFGDRNPWPGQRSPGCADRPAFRWRGYPANATLKNQGRVRLPPNSAILNTYLSI